MLAWSEELITDVRKPENHGYDVIVSELFTDYSDHPRKLVTPKPKTQINERRTLASFPLVGCPLPQAAWPEDFRKVRTLWHYRRWGRGALPTLIMLISVRQSTVAALSTSLPGAGYGQFEHKADNWCKFKAGGTVREIDVWQSPRLSPLWLSASSSACHGLLIITVITPLPGPARQKCHSSWRTRQLLTCRCVSVMLLRSMQKLRRS